MQGMRQLSQKSPNSYKLKEKYQEEGQMIFWNRAEPQQIYEQLIEPITWETDSKPASFVEQSISEKLVYHGDRTRYFTFQCQKSC